MIYFVRERVTAQPILIRVLPSRQGCLTMQDCIIAMQSLLILMRLKGIADTVLDYSEPDLAPTKHESGLHKIDN